MTWNDLKHKGAMDDDYSDTSWYNEMSTETLYLFDALRQEQLRQGNSVFLKPVKYRPPYQEDSHDYKQSDSDDYLDQFSESLSSAGQGVFVSQPKAPAKVTRKKSIKKQNS
jgi:hypothetical protein